jgi:glycosyltransferase involved in cell wall biosynthesis
VKVLVTVPVGERRGGAENMLFMFLRHVDRDRIVPLVVFLERGSFEREVASLGIRTLSLPAGRLRHPWTAACVIVSLSRLLQRERPDLILNWMPKSQLYGGTAAMLAGMGDRVVWWQHGVSEGHWLDRLATLLPARGVGCSSYASARAQDRLHPRRRTFVVYPGIDDTRADYQEVERLTAELGIPKRGTVVGIVGRFEPGKGHDRFVETVAELRRRGQGVHGLVVGGANGRWPAYQEHVRRLVDDLELDGAITFTGHVTNALPYIALMDVLVSVLATEAFGIVLLEAIAQGVVVVAATGGGPAEIVEHEQSGLLVNSGDPETVADAVERVVLDEDLRRRLVRGGRERYMERFTADKMAAALHEKLEELKR